MEEQNVLRGDLVLSQKTMRLYVIDNAISSAALQQLPPELIESLTFLRTGSCIVWRARCKWCNSSTVRGAQDGGKLTVSVNSWNFETIAYVPTTLKKIRTRLVWEHDPFENGSWGELFDDVNREQDYLKRDGNSLELPYSYIKDVVKQFYQTGTTYQNGFH
jgi:hypothetical protein